MNSRQGRQRVLLCSPDGFGIDPARRLLAVATALARLRPDLAMLAVAGAQPPGSSAAPANVDWIKLPSPSRRRFDGRTPTAAVTAPEVGELRAGLLGEIVDRFSPHLMIVEGDPLAKGLLDAVLCLAAAPHLTERWLAMPDVVGPRVDAFQLLQAAEWHETVGYVYKKLLFFGDVGVFDARREYHFLSDLAACMVPCGYVCPVPDPTKAATIRQRLSTGDLPIVVVAGGGDGDAWPLLDAFFAALASGVIPACVSVVIPGPGTADEHGVALEDMATRFPSVSLVSWTEDLPAYLAAADLVVTLGGMALVGAAGLRRRVVCAPAAGANEDQSLRASRFAERGLAQVVPPAELNGGRLAEAMRAALAGPPPAQAIDVGGAERVAQLVADALTV